MRRPTPSLVGILLLPAALLAGCGSDSAATRSTTNEGGSEPLTPRALAALVTEYTGAPSSAVQGRDMEELGNRLVAAVELRYGTDGEYDGDVFAVGVGTRLRNTPETCDEAQAMGVSGCAQTEEGLLFWEAHTPEEDPGVVYVQVSKGATDVVMFSSGPNITGDPRELDMPISVEDMFAIGADPRVDVTTSAEAVEDGAALDFWDDTGY